VDRVALISTPWPLFNRPSIQLGALNSFVRQNLSDVRPISFHIYLTVAKDLGYDLYREISERTWLAEPIYAALLYPDRREEISRFWSRRVSGIASLRQYDFFQLCHTLETISAKILESEAWERNLLAGLSICLGQLTSSLYFIREIKRRAPKMKTLVGGSACAGEMGYRLLRVFSEIDFVIQGEGELPLIHLIRSLKGIDPDSLLEPIPGLISRGLGSVEQQVSQADDLNELPIPDYSEYFKQLGSFVPEKRFLPKIPMEISRGCWWNKDLYDSKGKGCAFCNLNLQWKGYRSKSHDRIIAELEALVDRYQILSISFMDNLLPAKDLETLFMRIRGLGKDLRLFSEIRATTSYRSLAAMRAGGVYRVQVGIESLSTSLLMKLNKGTTAIDNLEIMKNCENPGLPDLIGNLMVGFPSSDEKDVGENMKNLDFALPFRPLKGILFWLGYCSPVWQEPGRYGLERIGNHPYYRHLFPPEILRGLTLMIQGYHGGVRHQNRLWNPVRERLKEWQEGYIRLHERPGCDPILSYQDGGSFMIIRQRRYGTDDMTHRLQGTSRKVYLYCENQRSMNSILSKFPGLGEEKVGPFLRMMVEKRLMFNEGDRYLSLAVPSNPFYKAPESLPEG
jgi:ribosomal peptide maturation radical SAM protein 1